MNAPAQARRSLLEPRRRDEDEIGGAQEPRLALRDPPRRPRARGQVVDAVVDRQRRIQLSYQVPSERCGQERPHDRPREARRTHPSPDRPQHRDAIDTPHQRRVRERQDDGRVHEEVGPLLPEPHRAPPPVPDALADAREVTDPRRPDPGVLHEQHAVARFGEGRHDFLVPLPDEVPVDRGDAQDVLPHGGGRDYLRRSTLRNTAEYWVAQARGPVIPRASKPSMAAVTADWPQPRRYHRSCSRARLNSSGVSR